MILTPDIQSRGFIPVVMVVVEVLCLEQVP